MKIADTVKALPRMLAGDELTSAMTIVPEYDESVRNEDAATRLMALSELYRIYLPSQMSHEIYSKLYLALLRSLQKKGTKLAVQQHNQNYRAIRGEEYSGILGGSDSFTIIGTSGIGKSSAISRALNLIAADGVIEIDEPYTKIVPCVVVQCPFDSSVKGLLLEILRKVDECLGSKYYQNAVRIRATTDMLIGSVSQVALNHIGLLVVDEIQNIVNSRHGRSLIGALTQLINNSGISICMVGTPESAAFFEQAMHLARRSLGLQYNRLEYGEYFQNFCSTLFGYQYIWQRTSINPAIIEWLYEHSGGVISVVVSLVHDAQEIAILNGSERLDMAALNEAYRQRLSLLHGYIEPVVKKNRTNHVKRETTAVAASVPETIGDGGISISELVERAKAQSQDILSLLKQHFAIEEVEV